MSTNVTLINGLQTGTTSATSVYTSPAGGGGTRIIAFTASLITGTETYRVFIGAAASAENEIIPATSIRGPENDSPLGVINELIPAGAQLWVQTSTATTIAFRSSGIEF